MKIRVSGLCDLCAEDACCILKREWTTGSKTFQPLCPRHLLRARKSMKYYTNRKEFRIYKKDGTDTRLLIVKLIH